MRKASRFLVIVTLFLMVFGLSIQAASAQGNVVDVFFLVDSTGSMGGFISGVKANILTIIDTIAATGADYQIGVAHFGDPEYGILQGLTSDTAAITSGVNALFASGGGDEPELTYCGAVAVLDGAAWRGGTRVIILIGDATPKISASCGSANAASTIANANSKGVGICAIPLGSPPVPSFTELATGTGCGVYPADNPADLVEAILDIIVDIPVSGTAVDECGVPIPADSVVGSLPHDDVRAYYRPYDLTNNVAVTLNPGTYWVIGQDETESFYKIILSCQYLWVPKETMGPNYDDVWMGRPLPDRIVS
jgi:hypothetical protein